MAVFKIETKNKVDIGKKPRVYFACHPDDFERYFKKICDDIFKSHDCAIYYTEDMTDVIAEDEKEVDLGRNNLFIVPVTFRLLSTPNRAMDEDIPYALKSHIPVLPVMMESGLDAFYSKPDKFGELQYLNPYSSDTTEISYEEKLKKYLDSVLISDETARRIRAAFDAYIFLSYRKKDRKYANELMRLIHNIPECRDIAIWFDEFLTPGESFKENIEKILDKSQFFTLLVTPNLLEEPGGKPNFVMGEEYPAAHRSGKRIIPAEMEETDKAILAEKFKEIPNCVNPEDEMFHKSFIEAVSKIAIESNNTPEHNFLIGLAYLDGIDVEVNREIAIELITGAAEAGLPEAMEKLYRMYNEGIGVQLDYRKAVIWIKALSDYYMETYGEEHPDTFWALNNLAIAYGDLGNHHKALELQEKVYVANCKVLGEEHPGTLLTLNNLALTCGKLGDYHKALELQEKVYVVHCKVLGEEHPDTLTTLNNLAMTYGDLGDHHKALELKEKVYVMRCKILGEEHHKTLNALNNLAFTYGKLGDYHKALELQEKVYVAHCKVIGEEHPDTLLTLNNLAINYRDIGDHHKALELHKKVYVARCKVLGEEHPDTIKTLNNLAFTYGDLGNYQKELEIEEKVYVARCKVLGEEHPGTLNTLNNLAVTYGKLGDRHKELELMKKAYTVRCKILGEEHPNTLTSLSNLAVTYIELGDHQKALELQEKEYIAYCKALGEKHPDTLNVLNNLAVTYSYLGDVEIGKYEKAIEYGEKVYKLRCRVLGEEDKATLVSLNNLAFYYKAVGDFKTALPLLEKLYAQQIKVYGADNPKTLKTHSKLEEVRSKLYEEKRKEGFLTSKIKRIFKK